MAQAQKKENYTPEMTAQIVSDYQAGTSVDDIAVAVGKSVRSVRSKLVREGVYVAKEKVTTRKVEGPTKKEILRALEATGFEGKGFEVCYQRGIDSPHGHGCQLGRTSCGKRELRLPFFVPVPNRQVESRFLSLYASRK